MTTATELLPNFLDVTRLAIASFLARYREPTPTACTQDLKTFLGRCQHYDPEVLRVTSGELETYVRRLERRGYAAATVARRLGTVATFYKYAVIDGVMLGLRVSEACAADITDVRYEVGYELLHVIGKGAKPAGIPLLIPVQRAQRQVGTSQAIGAG